MSEYRWSSHATIRWSQRFPKRSPNEALARSKPRLPSKLRGRMTVSGRTRYDPTTGAVFVLDGDLVVTVLTTDRIQANTKQTSSSGNRRRRTRNALASQERSR